jgi:DUF4097 and DUF4098 domain-containing protein YvlB
MDAGDHKDRPYESIVGRGGITPPVEDPGHHERRAGKPRPYSLSGGAIWLATFFVAVGVLAAAMPAWALEEFRFNDTKTFDVGAAPEINLETVSGDVTYTATEGNRATVDIVVDVRAKDEAEAQRIRDELDIRVEGRNGLLEARVKQPHDFSHWLEEVFGKSRMVSVSFHVRGPKGATGEMSSVSGEARITGTTGPIDISSVSGDVVAEDVSAQVKASAVSGSVEVTHCRGSVHAETVSGDVAVDSCSGTLRAETVSGTIEANMIAGDVDASTTSGDVRLRSIKGAVAASTTSGEINVDHEGGSLDLHSISGDLVAHSAKTSGRLALETISGLVKIYVSSKDVGEVRLSSSSGEIRVDAGLKVRKHSRHELSGRLGDGTSELEVSTASGDILLGEL